MIDSAQLSNRAESHPAALTDRQRQVVDLYRAYVQVALEPPSTSWLARRMKITRKTVYDHLQAIRDKGFLG